MPNNLSKNDVDKLLGLKSYSDQEVAKPISLDIRNKRDILSLINLSKELNLDLNNIDISWKDINDLLENINYDNVHLPSKNDVIPMVSQSNNFMTLEDYKDILLQVKKEIEENGMTDLSLILKAKRIIINSSAIVIK